MGNRIPELIQPLINDYLNQIEESLPTFLKGFYIHGSIALNAFNERLSDIDFIATISHNCTAGDLNYLAKVHRTIARNYPQWNLEGSYLHEGDLGKFKGTIAPYPAYHDGVLKPTGYHDINPVTWWILKNRGIASRGPEPGELAFTDDLDQLLAYMRQNLNTYWASFTRKPSRIAWLLTNYGVQWTVLGVLRQWYTIKEHSITSKTEAGEFALTHLPARWHRLIREAISLREQNKVTHYKSRVKRAVDLFTFLQFIIQVCNTEI